MILKGFKEKSIKKYLNNLLSEAHIYEADNKIESLGVIVNLDEIQDFNWFNELANALNIHPNKLKIIAFSTQKKETLNLWDDCYYPEDIGWKGVILNNDLKLFLDTKFDALLSYYEADVTELKLITVLSKAQFKIGILQTDERLNDLIINTKLNDFNVFKNEMFKYLTILNKIKNEK